MAGIVTPLKRTNSPFSLNGQSVLFNHYGYRPVFLTMYSEVDIREETGIARRSEGEGKRALRRDKSTTFSRTS